MRIIGVDPGLAALGMCVVEGTDVLQHRLITTSPEDGDECQRVQKVAGKVYLFIEGLGEGVSGENTILAIEAQYFAEIKGEYEEARRERAAKAASTIQVAHVAGAVMEVAARFGLQVIIITPSMAKKAILKGNASKAQVRGMAAQMAGVEAEELSEHEADSIAVACGGQDVLKQRKLEKLKEAAASV